MQILLYWLLLDTCWTHYLDTMTLHPHLDAAGDTERWLFGQEVLRSSKFQCYFLDGGKGCLQEASIFFAALMAFQIQVFHSFPQCWPSLIRFLLFAREFQHRRASIPWNLFSSPFQPAQNLWKDWSPSLLSCTAKAMLSKMPMRRWEEFKNWQQRFVIDATQGQLKTNQRQICVILDSWVKRPKLQTSYLRYEVPCATGGRLPNFQHVCKGSLSLANTLGAVLFQGRSLDSPPNSF